MALDNRVQYLAAFAVSLALMTNSMSYFWTAPILPKFHNNETGISITNTEISWVVSMLAPGMVTGSLFASSISDRFGRRFTLLGSAVPFIVGTLFVLWGNKPWTLYIGRYLWGGGAGLINTVSNVYLTEVLDKDIRGTLIAYTRFMFNFGVLLVLAIGSFLSYQVLSSFLIVLPICYFIACLNIPESPYYLLKEGKVDSARKELLKLCGKKDLKMVEQKLSLMRSDVRKEMLRSGSVKELLTGKQYRKAVIITTGLKVTQIMAGNMPIQEYLGRIIQQSNCGLEVSTALLIFGAVRFTVGLGAPAMIDKVDRRPLLIFSYLGVCSMLITIGAYFFLQIIVGIDEESIYPYRFVVFIAILCSVTISSAGFDTLVFIIPSEIFPINVRTIAMTVLNVFASLLIFIIIRGYQVIEDWLGLYAVFWFYASMAFSGAVFTYFIVPETRGKSLREIQIELQGNIYDDSVDDLDQDGKHNSDLEELIMVKYE